MASLKTNEKMIVEQQENKSDKNYQLLNRELSEKYKYLDDKYKTLQGQFVSCQKALATSKNKLEETLKVQKLFLEWARKQECELPQSIRALLPEDKPMMRKEAFAKVPYGSSPAGYALNVLYFLSLSFEEQAELGAKMFHREKDARPEDFAGLKNVTKELHEFIFTFPDDQIKMKAMYGYLESGVPKLSDEPHSDWVQLKKLSVNFFPVYTVVTVHPDLPSRGYTYSNLRSAKNKAKQFKLIAMREVRDRSGRVERLRAYRINAIYDDKVGSFSLVKDFIHNWEIANWGMADFCSDFSVSNLVMDNNPPYKEGMMGIVQILWTGTCTYDSCED